MADGVQDPNIRRYLYLDLSVDDLIEKMNTLQFNDLGKDTDVPFTASIRGYTGATDEDGDPWLVKEIPAKEAVDHAFQEMAYYIDFAAGTLAAPNVLREIAGVPYRATKMIKNALQISSYEYFNEPYKSILANDLVNRWIFFDEDRNPNNYLILHDSDRKPLVIAIDYNKADLRSSQMKITGMANKFGWERLEKTRFLTLLKPEHFASLSIATFECRLQALTRLTDAHVREMALKTFSFTNSTAGKAQEYADLLAKNFIARRDYIEAYFRKWFSGKEEATQRAGDDRYAGLGQSFLDYYKTKM